MIQVMFVCVNISLQKSLRIGGNYVFANKMNGTQIEVKLLSNMFTNLTL